MLCFIEETTIFINNCKQRCYMIGLWEKVVFLQTNVTCTTNWNALEKCVVFNLHKNMCDSINV